MGPLKFIKTVVPSVKGDIPLEIKNQPDAFSIKLVSPKGTTAIVGLPKRPGRPVRSITANDKSVWANSKKVKSVKGLKFLEETEHYITFEARPGSWEFSAAY